MEVEEISFTAQKSYSNPYLNVDLWVTLKGPNGQIYKIPTFWDGGSTFRARLVATSPGTWNWSTGSATGDGGLDNKNGSFSAIAWTEAEKKANPNRRGYLRAHKDGHTFEYADGTPFFYTGDTAWSCLTGVFKWRSANGAAQISFQDYFTERKNQGFNGVNLIYCFPTDSVAGKGIWGTAGKKVSDSGKTPFNISGGNAQHGQIDSQYWQEVDPRMQWFFNNGFVPFTETVRRTESWDNYFDKYVRYLWARYGCYNIIFSWLHWDNNSEAYQTWLPKVKAAYNYLKSKNGTGKMPYGQIRTAMAAGTTIETWWRDAPYLLDMHNVSNKSRNTGCFSWLRNIFNHSSKLPIYNIEGYYPYWRGSRGSIGTLDVVESAQFMMYGCVLNGAFAGHAWGDVYYGGNAYRAVSPIQIHDPQKSALNNFKSYTMGHLKKFMLDSGHDYTKLKSATLTHLSIHRDEMLALAVSEDESVALGFIPTGYAKSDLKGMKANTKYTFQWYNVDTGAWLDKTTINSSGTGLIVLPAIPDNSKHWAFRVKIFGLDYTPESVIP